MKEYFSRSIKKFKDDAFSKFIYDFLKWIVGLTAVFSLTKYIPSSKSVNVFLFSKFNISVYGLIIICLIITIANTIVLYSVFKKKYRNLQDDYFTDKLTGLQNQIALEKYFDAKIIALKDSNSSCSLILVDIDNFKTINEKFGYNLADEVIKKIGGVLGNDKRFTDEVFRYFQKGDEFLIVLNDTSLDGAIKAANRKKDLISKIIFEVNDIAEQFTVSCGVTEFNKINDDYKTITDRLNKALQEAKKQPNKNSVKSII
jgi:diguanylate cyclase (GGDEF)-like protein